MALQIVYCHPRLFDLQDKQIATGLLSFTEEAQEYHRLLAGDREALDLVREYNAWRIKSGFEPTIRQQKRFHRWEASLARQFPAVFADPEGEDDG